MDVPNEIVVFPSGRSRVGNQDVLMDREGAQECIRKFTSLGRDMVIDYDHASLQLASIAQGKSPAAGWVHGLRWDESRGLLAAVRWTERARGMLESGEYRFHSPVGYVRESDGRFVELYSVALTNQPLTSNIAAIV